MVLRSGRIQVLGPTDELLATHKRLLGPARPGRPKISGVDRIVTVDGTERQVELLVRTDGDVLDPAWDQHDVTLEDLVLAYLTEGSADQLRAVESVDA
jgi:hypothetical protein